VRQPAWTIDEVLLGVNAYFEIGDVCSVTSHNSLLIELSRTLRSLPFYKKIDDTFRNLPGVEMTLKSIAVLDDKSKYSMKNYTKLQREVYGHYNNDKSRLRKVSEAIRACLPLPFEYRGDLRSPFQMMGNILWQYHLYIEQESQIVKALKQNSRERRKSSCDVCGTDLYYPYGDKGIVLLEHHYSEDITNYDNTMRILQSKFVAVCPTCHKFAHSQPEYYIFNNLKQMVQVKKEKNV
jgi:hypothetical protein